MVEQQTEIMADFHETESGAFYAYSLGRISLDWNMVEHYFTALIWEFLGDYDTGMAVTLGLGGNKSKADVLVALARQRSSDKPLMVNTHPSCHRLGCLTP